MRRMDSPRLPLHFLNFPTNLQAEAESFEDITKRTFPELERDEVANAEGAALSAELGEMTDRELEELAADFDIDLSEFEPLPEQGPALLPPPPPPAPILGKTPDWKLADAYKEYGEGRLADPEIASGAAPIMEESWGELRQGAFVPRIPVNFAGYGKTPDEVYGAGDGVLSGPPPPPRPFVNAQSLEEDLAASGIVSDSGGELPVPTPVEFSGSEAIGDGVLSGPAGRRPPVAGPLLVPEGVSHRPVDPQMMAPISAETGQSEGDAVDRRSLLKKFVDWKGEQTRLNEERNARVLARDREAVAMKKALAPFHSFDEPVADGTAGQMLAGAALVKDGAPVADGAPVTEAEAAVEKISAAAKVADLAKWPTNVSPTVADAEGKSSFQQTRDVLQGRLDAVEQEDGADATQQATEFFNTLTDANKTAYSDLKAGLKELSAKDAKDFEQLETRFKALDDFHKTGKLPERMRQDRITNLMLEMSKGLLGNQNLYDAFRAGVEGFQAVDKAARKEYADGLSTMLTASKGIIDSKMAMRNSRRQESIAMTKFAAAENRGNASLAMDQLKIAQQAKQNARTHEINLIRGEAALLQADIAMVNATKGSEKERLLKSMPKQMYPGILARARETGDTTELDKYYRKDSQGKVHANITAFIPHIAGLSSSGASGLGVASFAMRVGAAQQDIISDAKKDAKTLAVNWTDPVWRDVADFARTKGFNPAGTIPSLKDWTSEGKGAKNKGWWQKMAEAYYKSIDKRALTLPGSSQRTTNQNQVRVQPRKDLGNIITAPQ